MSFSSTALYHRTVDEAHILAAFATFIGLLQEALGLIVLELGQCNEPRRGWLYVPPRDGEEDEMSNFSDVILMTHVLFGMLCIIASVWVFVDVLNASEANQARIKGLSVAVAVFMWLAYLIGGYWYVVFYATDKALILKGPWPFAHNFVMEMKEHVILMLLLLATYLPIAASSNLFANRSARSVVLWVAGLIALIGMTMDGSGAIIGMGAKVALLAK